MTKLISLANAATDEDVIAALKESHESTCCFSTFRCPGRGGFEVIEQVGPAHMPVTVFVTAHNQYAVQAFEVHALDYLTKPIEPERLRTTLARVKERIASSAALLTQEQLKSVLASLENDNKRGERVSEAAAGP